MTTRFWLSTRKPKSRPNLSLVIDRTVSVSASRSVTASIANDVTRSVSRGDAVDPLPPGRQRDVDVVVDTS